MKRRSIPRLAGIAATLWAGLAQADTYYVAPPPAGNDGNPGSLAQPWATLQQAADEVGPGDTVVVRAGDYAGAEFTTSGMPQAPIVLQAFPGETPRVVSDISSARRVGINLEGASWMTVDGFQVDGRGQTGIRAVTCEHVTLRNNRTNQNATWGILTGFCDDLLIENNIASNSAQQHGIYVSNSGDRPIVRNNIMFGNRQNGLHMNGDFDSQAPGGSDGIISDALVENNIIYSNGVGGGSGINMDGVQNSLIRNNLIYDARASGISVYRIDGGGGSNGNRILNNTVIVSATGRWALNIQDTSTGNVARNNVLFNLRAANGAIDICSTCLTGFSSDRNVVVGRFVIGEGSTLTLAQWRTQTAQDLNSVASDSAAVFENVAASDYRLNASSPALNIGEARIDVPSDLVGTARPQAAGWDIGTYERPDAAVLFANGFE